MIKTVKDLKKALESFGDETKVFIEISNDDGCETCGYGATAFEDNVVIRDLETKIIISH